VKKLLFYFLLIIWFNLFSNQIAERLYFESDPIPVDSLINRNPLDFSSDFFGIEMRDFNLPRGYESKYRFNCRFPVIDQVANNPLYLVEWLKTNYSNLRDLQKNKTKTYLESVITLLDGVKPDTPEFEIGKELVTELLAFKDSLATTGFSPEYRIALENLFGSCMLIYSFQSKALEKLSGNDLEFLQDNPGYYLLPDGKSIPFLTGDNSSQQKYIKIIRKVNYEYIFAASILLQKASEKYLSSIQELEEKSFYPSDTILPTRFIYEAEFGRFVIADEDNDIHNTDAAVLIDLGGNDIYKNNAGSNYPGNNFFSLQIDHRGNDIYSARETEFVQGFGFLGTGILYDLAGNDRYNGLRFAQGSGICGIGLLWDRQGDDAYYCNAFCQGAGMFGAGILLDDKGHDKYDCATLGQGAATTLGLGILSDLDGNDRYLLSSGLMKESLGILPGYGQGGALSFRDFPWNKSFTAYGGIGLLFDDSGNDSYKTEGWCDQGGSYIMSLGALYDNSGDDEYFCNTGQGSGIHITNAILIDRSGNDKYHGNFRAGGSGGDRSPGIFLEYGGDDEYYSKTSSYGTGVKPFSYSLFVDFKGNDLYQCSQPAAEITFNNWDSYGGVWPESEAHLWPYSMCFDLGGEDDYQVRNRKNNSYRHSFGHGIHIDMTWSDTLELIGKVEPPLPEYEEFNPNWGLRDSIYCNLIEALDTNSLFSRFQLIGEISDQKSEIIGFICEALKKSDNKQLNRDLMEALHHFYIENRIPQNSISHLISLLNARDEEVRLLTAQDLGNWKIHPAEQNLWQVLEKEKAAQVRRFALGALRKLDSWQKPDLIKEISLNDESADVRRNAVYMFSENAVDFQDYFEKSDRFINDVDASVRIAYIRGIGEMKKRDLIPSEMSSEILRFLYYYADQLSHDIYLQRAIGEVLAWFGEIRGVEMLISSLSFPSIDAFENYNHNIPNTIAGLVNHDFSEPERYDKQIWQDWFAENGEKVDLKYNIGMLEELKKLSADIDQKDADKKIRRYEIFLEQYPESVRVKKDLANLFNREAWEKVTSERDLEFYDPDLGLYYALRAVELDPSLNHLDTLAEAYLAFGLEIESRELCERVLEDYPENEMFLKRIEALSEQ